MFTVIYVILGFVILVFAHELGHFLFAKLTGVMVEEFAIGMGKAIWQKKYKNTVYKIGMIPIGGYCRLKGQDDFGPVTVNTDSDSFYVKPPYVRFLISFGGPLFSYLLGFIFLTMVFIFSGETKLEYTKLSTYHNHPVFQDGDEIIAINGQIVKDWNKIEETLYLHYNKKPVTIDIKRGNTIQQMSYIPDMDKRGIEFVLYANTHPVILTVGNNTAAEREGLKKGDIVLEINGIKITNEAELKNQIKTGELPLKIKILRYENPYAYSFILPFVAPFLSLDWNFPAAKKWRERFGQNIIEKKIIPDAVEGKKILGIQSYCVRNLEKYIKIEEYSLDGALNSAFYSSFNIIVASFKGIVYLLQGDINVKDNLSGPIQIFYLLGKMGSEGGFLEFLRFAALISLALAFFNLLPFPALDGGHMVIAIIETITRKRVHPKVMSYLQIIGIVILLGMMAFVSINDIVKLTK